MMRWLWLVGGLLAVCLHGVGETPPETPGPPAEARPEIVRLSATRSRLGLIEFDHTSREITIPAEINMVKGLLEYALVGEKGKLHEALLSTKARAFDLNIVLLLLNYQPDEQWFVPPAKPKPLAASKPAARLEIFVRWKEAGRGPDLTARLDEWITDIATKNRPRRPRGSTPGPTSTRKNSSPPRSTARSWPFTMTPARSSTARGKGPTTTNSGRRRRQFRLRARR